MESGVEFSSPCISNGSSSIPIASYAGHDQGTSLQLLSLSRLSSGLEKLLIDPGEYEDYNDADIVVEGISVGVNRGILAARSQFFHEKFKKAKKDCDGKPKFLMTELVPCGWVGYEAFTVFLNYVYTGKNKASPPEVSICVDESCDHYACRPAIDYYVQLMYASATFQIKELVMLIQRNLDWFVDNAAIEDVIPILLVAFHCSLAQLVEHCVQRVTRSNLDNFTLEKELPGKISSDIKARRLNQQGGVQEVEAANEKRIRKILRALDCNDVELVKMLLEESEITLDDAYAVHYAAAYCNSKVVNEVLGLGKVDLNLRNAQGYTVLHLAARRKDPAIIVAILDKSGASIRDATCCNGHTAVTICRRSTRPKDYNKTTEHGQEKNNDRLCIDVLEGAMMNGNPISLPSSAPLENDLVMELYFLENRVALARTLYPREAKINMEIATLPVKHVKALTELGPHPVGSNSLDSALQYVLQASEAIKKEAHWEVDVEIDLFHSNSGANHLVGGLFKGKTLVYSDLNHIVLRISPKYGNKAEGNAILVSSHIDTVFSTEGAGDCSSCVAVMLELARGICHWAHGFKNSVIFLFNTGEEEGLNGAHSFVTQHPWSDIVRVAIDLEAMGIGGKSGIFQAGPDPWAIENYAQVAKYPSAQIVAQDLFTSGVIKSATDFQVYRELGGLSGLDFAYTENTAIYHTKNDKLSLLKPGSLQHLGENMLAFLLRAAASTNLPGGNMTESEGKSSQDTAIYFDFLGTYMIVFRQHFADMLYNSVILQSLLIWIVSLFVGGYSAVVSLAFSCLSIVLMWICSIGFSLLVAFVLPLVSPSPVPFVSCPWLVVGLFAAPALLGAFGGQHVGYLVLEKYLSRTFSQTKATLSPAVRHAVAKLDAERWIFKAGLLQWLVLLSVGHFFKIGSSYLALVWLVPPAFAYGLLDATLSPARLPKPLKTLTLLIGLSVPFLTSSGLIIRLVSTVIGTSVRFVRNPGGTPEWLGNAILALFIAAIVCLTLVYLLSYIHISGAKVPLVIATCILFGVSLGMVLLGVIPPFTEDTARAVNVVHVVDATGPQDPVSYISLFSTTPGNLIKEAEQIGEGFICGRDKPFDFVTFSVKYSCWTNKSAEIGWKESDIPALHAESDIKGDSRVTRVLVDTKVSTRWSLGINTDEVEDFQLKDDSEELISLGDKSSTDGWHTIQFSGGKKAPTKFSLTLFWHKNNSRARINEGSEVEPVLLKLRTDVDRQTPKTAEILKKLPPWCSLFGKSTSPYTLAFFKSLPVAL